MNQDTIKSVYTLLGTPFPKLRGGWVIGSCPFAKFRHDGGKDNHPSFGIRITDTSISNFHCFSCNSHGDVMDLAIDLATLYKGIHHPLDLKTLMEVCSGEVDDVIISAASIPDYQEATITPKIDYDFPNWWLAQFPSVFDSETARAYLSTRQITVGVAKELDLRWDDKQSRVCFPYRNVEGLLVGMNGRAVLPSNELRYYQYPFENKTNLHLWYREDKMNLDTPLLVTESVFDVASILRVYDNVVAGFSCSFSKEKALRLGDAMEIVTLFDAGKGGDIARKTIKKHLGKVVTKQFTPKGDAGDMTVPELEEMLGETLNLSSIDKR